MRITLVASKKLSIGQEKEKKYPNKSENFPKHPNWCPNVFKELAITKIWEADNKNAT